MDGSDNHERHDSHANAFVQAESSRLEHAATLSLCPACGTMVRRLDARHCSTCGRAFAIAVDYLPADALRASYHTQQHCPPQSIEIKADKAGSAGSNHLRSKTFVSAAAAQPARYSNNASQLALAFATYALVPYLGILFCPGAIITGCVGFVRVHQTPYIGGRRASLQGIIAGILILCAQLFCGGYFTKCRNGRADFMATKIAKIVKSNSHVDYVGRIIDALDADAPPQSFDYGFAQFVSIPLEDKTEVIGVVYDSQLANPDYANFGPRLSSFADLSVLSPDYLNEQGVLIGILLLGWRDESAKVHQSVPRRVIPANQDVYRLDEKNVQSFHRDAQGQLQLHYYSQIITHAGAFSVALIEAIIEQLEPACTPEEKQRLCVLKQTLVWQRTVGGMRI